MQKQPEVKAKTRQNLINAFWQLYKDKSISQIRILEITDLAGYHRGTFYEYFIDIYDVLEQEEDALIEELKQLGTEVNKSEKNANIFTQIYEFYLNNGSKLNMLIGAGGDPEFIYKMQDTIYPIFQQTSDLPDETSSALVYKFGISGMIMAFHYWYENKEQIPIEKFMSIMHSLIGKGVFPTIQLIKSDQMPDLKMEFEKE